MTLVLELEAETERLLEEAAARDGVSKEEWAINAIKNYLREVESKRK